MSRRKSRHFTFQQAFEECRAEVFVVDAVRRVLSVGTGITDLTGWEPAQVATELCELGSDHSADSVQALTSALCPPPEAMTGEVIHVSRHFVHRETGHVSSRTVHFFPLLRNQKLISILGVLTPHVPPVRSRTAADSGIVSEVHADLASLRHQLRQRYGLSSIVCRSPAMHRVLDQVELATGSSATIHIHGEPGTGCEHVARAIHYSGNRSTQAFVPLDCQSLPFPELRDSINRLLETEWAEITPIAALHPGAIYLKNVESLPRELQQRLVEFLSANSGREFREKVRLISSSRQSLESLTKDDGFVPELFFRLTMIAMELPPLRDRADDFPYLVQHFVERQNHGRDRQLTGVATETLALLAEYNWPGNLTELEQVIQQAAASATDSQMIRPSHLPFQFRNGLDAQHIGPAKTDAPMEPLEELVRRIETEQITEAMRRSRNNRTMAAKLLGLTRPAFYRRLESLGLFQDDPESRS